MSGQVLLLAAMLLLLPVPLAHGQAPALAMEVVAEPFPHPLAPLGAVGTVNVTARVPCALMRADSGTLRWWAEPAPAWLDDVIFTPQETRVDLVGCGAEGALVHATLTARATVEAPAFEPAALVIQASFESGGQNATSAVQTMVEADYFAILELVLAEAIQVGRPGERLVYPVDVKNLGNGRTRIAIEVLDASEGFIGEVPAMFTLDADASRTVGIAITNPEGAGYMNQVGVLNVRVHAEHADDRGTNTDEANVSLLATAKGVASPVPGPGLPLVLGLVAVAAYSRRVFSR